VARGSPPWTGSDVHSTRNRSFFLRNTLKPLLKIIFIRPKYKIPNSRNETFTFLLSVSISISGSSNRVIRLLFLLAIGSSNRFLFRHCWRFLVLENAGLDLRVKARWIGSRRGMEWLKWDLRWFEKVRSRASTWPIWRNTKRMKVRYEMM
jgi:hypothetical protein